MSPAVDSFKRDDTGNIAPAGTWTRESMLDRGTPWNLLRVDEPGKADAPPAPPPFTPPPPSAPIKPAAIPTVNSGGQAETEGNKIVASGVAGAKTESSKPADSAPTANSQPGGSPDEITLPATPIDAQNWYTTLSRRSLR
jgi:hypothetical protein